jgi:mono/diheme cytochrome c family protein
MIGKVLLVLVIAVLVLFLLMQLVPYGHNRTNPAVRAEPPWDSPQTRELAARACFDCHSNETHWPWYSYVAPASWLVQRDVQSGRRKLNFSEWDRPQREADSAAEVVAEGEMPPFFYVPFHPSANLSAAEKEALVTGLQKAMGGR